MKRGSCLVPFQSLDRGRILVDPDKVAYLSEGSFPGLDYEPNNWVYIHLIGGERIAVEGKTATHVEGRLFHGQ
mgnify:CR=1 FL=1